MSNAFLSTALILLASEEVGCVVEGADGNIEALPDCHQRVYGSFRPAALISNMAVVTGVLSAIFMPLAGAVVDFTSHRWTTGVIAATAMIIVQVIQIGINSNTWFAVAILQALQGCLFQIHTLTFKSYLSTISQTVSERTMIKFNSIFVFTQFGTQALFLVVVVGIAMARGLNDLETAQLSQVINSTHLLVLSSLGWRLLPKVPPKHTLEEGKSLLWDVFRQGLLGFSLALVLLDRSSHSLFCCKMATIYQKTTTVDFS